jgi:hypothetical protein
LNYAIHAALDKRRRSDTAPVEVNVPPGHGERMQELVDQFADLGAVSRRSAGEVVFPNPERALFVAGGWLERHTFLKLTSLVGDLQLRDVSNSVTVSHRGTDNELDVLAVRGSRLYAIECKTRAEAPDGRHSAHALYKLDSLGRLGGRLNMRSMFVSYRPLAEETKRRADDLGIEVVDAPSLGSLSERLRSWIGKPKAAAPS